MYSEREESMANKILISGFFDKIDNDLLKV